MTAHRLINIGLSLAGAIFFAAALSLSHLLGPDDLETERIQVRDLESAQRQAQRQARMEKAALEACGANASYHMLHGGGFQCTTKHGRKTHMASAPKDAQ